MVGKKFKSTNFCSESNSPASHTNSLACLLMDVEGKYAASRYSPTRRCTAKKSAVAKSVPASNKDKTSARIQETGGNNFHHLEITGWMTGQADRWNATERNYRKNFCVLNHRHSEKHPPQLKVPMSTYPADGIKLPPNDRHGPDPGEFGEDRTGTGRGRDLGSSSFEPEGNGDVSRLSIPYLKETNPNQMGPNKTK